MKIKCKAEIDMGHKTVITAYDGIIEHEDTNIGEIRFTKINRNGADFADLDWALDGQDSDETQIDFLFDDDGYLNFGSQKTNGNVICIAHLKIKKPFRGIGLGYYIIQKVIRGFGADCEVAVLWSKPLQFTYPYNKNKEYKDYPQDELVAEKKDRKSVV
jgi:hypothetical protein